MVIGIEGDFEQANRKRSPQRAGSQLAAKESECSYHPRTQASLVRTSGQTSSAFRPQKRRKHRWAHPGQERRQSTICRIGDGATQL